MDILVHKGIGDMIMLESYLTDSFRASINELYIKDYSLVVSMFNYCKATKHINVLPVSYCKETARDWELPSAIDLIRSGLFKFYGSSFLKYEVANISHIKLPKKFIVVQSQTPFNPILRREQRDLRPWEWKNLINILEENDTTAVALNTYLADHPPAHPRIIDMVGQTTIGEGVEILKKADGYIGINSWLSVCAAQLFEANQLYIRGSGNWFKNNKDIFYRPHTTFDFVHDFIGTQLLPLL